VTEIIAGRREEDLELSPQELQELEEMEASSLVSSSEEKEKEEKEGMSYADLYSSLVLNGELIVTLPSSEVERVKIGLKNYKSKQATRFREQGIPVDSSTLYFAIKETNKQFTKLIIALVQKPTLPILEIEIPDNEF